MAGDEGLDRAHDRRPLRVQVRELLERRIMSGRYAPGEQLVEYRLAQELGVSQTPVREALRDLESRRLVEIREHVGTRVSMPAPEEDRLVDLLRLTVEAEAARLAAPRLQRHPLQLAGLRAHVDAMREAERAQDPGAMAEHGVAFHRGVVEASGSQLLMDVWNLLGVELRTARAIRSGVRPLEESAEEHLPILEALERGDGKEAARRQKTHAKQWHGA